MRKPPTRRELILGAGTGAVVLATVGCEKTTTQVPELEVTPTEDLMREHGILARVLGVYTASATRLAAGDRSVLAAVRGAADIARDFVEGYHERIEERFVFPRFEAAKQLPELITTLRHQHEAGRGLTAAIAARARGGLIKDADRDVLVAALRGYVAMFEPHVAREDTIVFPLLKRLAGRDYHALGEIFEAEEEQHFGKDGFELYVAMLPELEIGAGVADLSTFTVEAVTLSV